MLSTALKSRADSTKLDSNFRASSMFLHLKHVHVHVPASGTSRISWTSKVLRDHHPLLNFVADVSDSEARV